MNFSSVYKLLDSETISSNGPSAKTPLGRIDEYLHDIISIIENDNPASLSDIKILANAARHELEGVTEF